MKIFRYFIVLYAQLIAATTAIAIGARSGDGHGTDVSADIATSAPQGLEDVIISYPADTPQWVLDQAMDMIVDAGGTITHEYDIIRGFSATAPEYILASILTLSPDYQPIIEKDEEVSIDNGTQDNVNANANADDHGNDGNEDGNGDDGHDDRDDDDDDGEGHKDVSPSTV